MSSNDEEHTYYLSRLLKSANDFPPAKKQLQKQLGVVGGPFLKTSMLSDKFKLGVLKKTHPEYEKQINALQQTLPHIQKIETFKNKYLSTPADAMPQYNLHSSIINHGGKYKSKNIHNKRKKTKKNTKKIYTKNKKNIHKKTKKHKNKNI
jgi:hypothetical protein